MLVGLSKCLKQIIQIELNRVKNPTMKPGTLLNQPPPQNRLLPIFSPNLSLNGQIWFFSTEKWIFSKRFGCFMVKSGLSQKHGSLLGQMVCLRVIISQQY